MTRMVSLLTMALGAALASGCAHVRDECAQRPKTIFEWALGAKDEEQKDSENGSEKSDDGDDKTPAADKKEPRAGNDRNSDEEKRLQSDRPDFLETSTTVGRGHVQFEGGYTYAGLHDPGSHTRLHSYPEALFRVGMLAEWFELRIGQNFASSRSVTAGEPVSITGAEDLYLGSKLALTEQKRLLPEMAVILQMTVPSGSPAFSAGKVLPGINWLLGWDLIPDRLDFGFGLQGNRAIDPTGHAYLEIANAASLGYRLTRRAGAYTEWFALYPDGAISASVGPQHYFDAGVTYLATSNFQLDARGGVGLNRRAQDYFLGAGLTIRR